MKRREVSPIARLSLATLVEHPWNAEFLHSQLAVMRLGERDRGWTVSLNTEFAWKGERSIPGRLVAIGECAATHSLSDEQARLLGVALAWVCSTTAVAYRHRAAVALARTVRTRPLVAAGLVRAFSSVDDPQVFEAVLYGAAACAMKSATGTIGFDVLARAVHTAVFAGATVQPHVIIRHYAQVVCDQASAKGALPTDIDPKSYHAPLHSEWPPIMSEDEETALEAEHKEDWKASRALGALLSSTRTEQMGGYGDWGRYEMGSVVRRFRRTPLSNPLEPGEEKNSYDDRIARRYVLGRVLDLGLDKASQDKPPQTEHYGRERPPVERLGKKYQWIALYEFLGYLTDHYHYCYDSFGSSSPVVSTVHLGLSDLLDPVLMEGPSGSERDEWAYVRSTPWWVSLPDPYPHILGKKERNSILAAAQTDSPGPLLRVGPNGEWVALAGFWEWTEPVPCWVGKDVIDHQYAGLEWSAKAYAVPSVSFREFITKMRGPCVGRGMIEDCRTLRAGLDTLVPYPDSVAEHEEDCARTFSKVPGAWFTVSHFEPLTEGSDERSGIIPSPQLARMADLRWTHEGFNFKTASAKTPEFQNLRQGKHQVTLIDAALLTRLLAASGLQIVWRLYGWKWCHGVIDNDDSPVREYWSLFALDTNGHPECIGGGTWVGRPSPVEEPLPW